MWSVDSDKIAPLNKILESKNTDLLEVLFKILTKDLTDMSMKDQALLNFYVRDRAKVKPYLLQKVDTGTVSD